MSLSLVLSLLFLLTNSSKLIYELLYSCEMYIQNPRETVYKNKLSLGITIEEYIENTFIELLTNLNTEIINNKIFSENSIKGSDVSFNISLATTSIDSKQLITDYLNNKFFNDITTEITPLNAYILESSINISWKEVKHEIITNVDNNNDIINNNESFIDKFRHIEWYYLVIFAVIIIVIIWFMLYICCIFMKNNYCCKYQPVNNGHYKEDSNMDISKNVWRKKSRLSLKNENDENDEIIGFGLDEDDLRSMSIFKNKKNKNKLNRIQIITKKIDNNELYYDDDDDDDDDIDDDDIILSNDINLPHTPLSDTPQDKTVTI